MSPRLEKEIKISVKNFKPIIEKIETSGAELEQVKFFEDNFLLDFPSLKLFKNHSALRVRLTPTKHFLTFKGKPDISSKFKIRPELETEIKNGSQLIKILNKLGLKIKFHYQKYRTVYRKNNLKINLDETPIGKFLELEGEENEIKEFAHYLGFSEEDFIKLDYVELFRQKHQGNMIFKKLEVGSKKQEN
ncbi:MAG: class IV adenylate cyclase [Candidatus Aminicenantia bacterium]